MCYNKYGHNSLQFFSSKGKVFPLPLDSGLHLLMHSENCPKTISSHSWLDCFWWLDNIILRLKCFTKNKKNDGSAIFSLFVLVYIFSLGLPCHLLYWTCCFVKSINIWSHTFPHAPMYYFLHSWGHKTYIENNLSREQNSNLEF